MMSELRPSQQCPICGAIQPVSHRSCAICGAGLSGQPTPIRAVPAVPERSQPGAHGRYDPAEGDDDLYAGDLMGRVWRTVLIVGIVVALAAGVGIGVVISRIGQQNGDGGLRTDEDLTQAPTAPPTSTSRPGSPTPSPTPRATLSLPTVTPAPPTPTDEPTPGPCMQTARADDTVYGMAIRCGHVDLSIVDLILQINNMTNAAELQIGQTLEIPWPTPTPGGEPVSQADTAQESEVQYNLFGTPDTLSQYLVEPTLRPGQAWHTVRLGETILSIAIQYEATVETLSQINPEIAFLQCDYGLASGGPTCSVMLYEGQRIRVPVPLPTATYTPTPIGTLTPTPTATPTYNAPFLLTPADGAHFNADQMVTTRWGGTGALTANEYYLVRVRDLTTGQEFVAPVRDTTYILPGGWQPADRNRHTFEWTISVGVLDAQYAIVSENYLTAPRRFTWDSR